ncbi:unnamed protein product [Effrenium voratum]|uniref:Nickel/cobalt efflux system n=1 Tax=Effrenium voratum TaxID=2562239 RepID=A0AA36IZH4_9DINO|nr:unnamed protein product [Effrenium voratum]CAJ1429203.1 unnamed protein product [Effrenium voratum]
MADSASADLTQELLGEDDADTASLEELKHQATQVLSGIAVATVISTCTLLLLVPELLTAGLLAYTLGLRHAVDADHIAAIDNIAKRLTTMKKQNALSGFFFALGHSTVVVIMCGFVAVGRQSAMKHMKTLSDEGGIIAGVFAGGFLIAVGVMNLCTVRVLLEDWREQKRYGQHDHAVAGLCMSCCPRLFNGITASWQMYPVGFLFGLGFDTSSEIALLAMVGLSSGLRHPGYVMILPVMFLAGMCLVDTLNGLFMAWLYGKTSSGMQRLYFNIYLTATTAMLALFIGSLELLGVAATVEGLKQGFWSWVVAFNANFELVGITVVFFFLLNTALAIGCYRRLFPEDRRPVRKDLLKYIERGEFIDRSGI